MNELIESTEEKTIRAAAPQLIKAAKNVSIWDEDSANHAANIAKLLSEAIKVAEDERKKIVKPINDSVKLINTRFKSLTDPLDTALATVKSKLLQFRREQDKIRMAQAEAARLAAVESAAPVVAAPVSPQTKGQFGSASTRKRWVFSLVDITKVSPDLLMVNAVAVNKLISDGVRELLGLKIYQDEDITIR